MRGAWAGNREGLCQTPVSADTWIANLTEVPGLDRGIPGHRTWKRADGWMA